MKSKHWPVCAAVLGMVFTAPSHAAERGNVVLGAGVNAATLAPRHAGPEDHGVGLELSAGFAFGSRWSVIAITSGAQLDDAAGESFTLGHLDALAQRRFGASERRLQPHLEAGLSRRSARFASTDGVAGEARRHAGWGPTVGAGISYAITPSLSLGATWRHTFGEFSGKACPSDAEAIRTCATSTRLGAGFSWYPGRR